MPYSSGLVYGFSILRGSGFELGLGFGVLSLLHLALPLSYPKHKAIAACIHKPPQSPIRPGRDGYTP